MAEIRKNKKLLKLKRRKRGVVQKMKKRGWTLKSAPKEGRGAVLLERYSRFARQADTLRKKLYDECLTSAIHEFHASKDGDEIARQLNGIKPSEFLAPPTVHYQLPTRARIARLFSEMANITNRDELFSIRMQLVQEAAQLCKQREPSRRQNSKGAHTAMPNAPSVPKASTKAVSRRSRTTKAQETTVSKAKAAPISVSSIPAKLEDTPAPPPLASQDSPTSTLVPTILRIVPSKPEETATPTGTLTCPFCHCAAGTGNPAGHKCDENGYNV